MQRRSLSILCVIFLWALGARAQDYPPPEINSDFSDSVGEDWAEDPLDVLEPEVEKEPEIPTVPEFTEIPEPGEDWDTASPPPPTTIEEPAPVDDIFAPSDSIANTPLESPLMGDEPDLSRESRFHRIYKKYNEQPTSEESWEQAVGDRSMETYQVQKGDTLWDISNTFFGDPNYWPKIWALNNGKILNPHEINPQMSISFYPGSMNDAPTLGVDEEGAPAKTKEGPRVRLAQNSGPLPPPLKKRAPVLKNIPASLPSILVGGVGHDLAPAELELPVVKFPQPVALLPYFISEQELSGLGTITETEMGLQSAMEFQYIFVRMTDPNPIGREFMVQRARGEVQDLRDPSKKGYLIEVQGLIKVVERVNPEQPVYRALVTKTLEQIEVGADVVLGELPVMDLKRTPLSSATVNGQIIGGQYDNNRKIFGNNTVVFLNVGANQGIQPGQTFNIFADQSVRNSQTLAVTNDRPIGTLKVIRTTPNFTTAYITKAEMDVLAGDYVGQRSSQAANFAPEASPSVGDDFDLDLDLDDSANPAPLFENSPDSGDDELDLDL